MDTDTVISHTSQGPGKYLALKHQEWRIGEVALFVCDKLRRII